MSSSIGNSSLGGGQADKLLLSFAYSTHSAALLGFKCSIDSQCEQRVANSFCSAQLGRVNNNINNGDSAATTPTTTPAKLDGDDGARVCSCRSNFIAYRRDKCLPGKFPRESRARSSCHPTSRPNIWPNLSRTSLDSV